MGKTAMSSAPPERNRQQSPHHRLHATSVPVAPQASNGYDIGPNMLLPERGIGRLHAGGGAMAKKEEESPDKSRDVVESQETEPLDEAASTGNVPSTAQGEKGHQVDGASQLPACPACGRRSLFWRQSKSEYRCVNVSCSRVFSEAEFEALADATGYPAEARWQEIAAPADDVEQPLPSREEGPVGSEGADRDETTPGESGEEKPGSELTKPDEPAESGPPPQQPSSETDHAALPTTRKTLPLAGAAFGGMWRGIRWAGAKPYGSRRFRMLGEKVSKALLGLITLALLIFLVWTGYHVFQQKDNPIWGTSPTVGVIAFIGTAVALLVAARVLRSRLYEDTSPSFRLVFVSVLAVYLVCAYAGVEPFSTYQERVHERVGDWTSNIEDESEEQADRVTDTPQSEYGTTKIVEEIWAITLNGVRWEDNALSVELTVENRGEKAATFGERESRSVTTARLMAKDSMGNWAHPDQPGLEDLSAGDNAQDWQQLALWEGHFFRGDYWPGETKRGELLYNMGPKSTGVVLHFSNTYYVSYLDDLETHELLPLFDIHD